MVEPAAEAQAALLETQAAKMMCCCHEMWPSVPRGTHRPYPPMTIELDCIWTHTRSRVGSRVGNKTTVDK